MISTCTLPLAIEHFPGVPSSPSDVSEGEPEEHPVGGVRRGRSKASCETTRPTRTRLENAFTKSSYYFSFIFNDVNTTLETEEVYPVGHVCTCSQ